MRNRTKIALVAAPVTAAATLLIPMSAAAAPDQLAPQTGACPGALVGTYAIDKTADLQVWYSRANGGTNCVKTVSTTGKSHQRYLSVKVTVSGSKESRTDEGFYRYYAGPEIITGTAGKCISVKSEASRGAHVRGASKGNLINRHCG